MVAMNKATALDLYSQIQERDSVLESASGSAEAGKRAIANSLATETEASWKKNVDNLSKALNGIEDVRTRAGVYTGIVKSLREQFHKPIDAFLEEEAAKTKSDAPAVSAEEVSKAQSERKELVTQYKALKEVLVAFGEDVDDLPDPKRMGGPRGKQGKRGKQLPKNLVLSYDGKDRSPSQNNLSNIYATQLKDVFSGTPEFREWLAAQGLDFENFPESFSYTLPNGKVIAGRLEEEVQDEEEEENEEGEEKDFTEE